MSGPTSGKVSLECDLAVAQPPGYPGRRTRRTGGWPSSYAPPAIGTTQSGHRRGRTRLMSCEGFWCGDPPNLGRHHYAWSPAAIQSGASVTCPPAARRHPGGTTRDPEATRLGAACVDVRPRAPIAFPLRPIQAQAGLLASTEDWATPEVCADVELSQVFEAGKRGGTRGRAQERRHRVGGHHRVHDLRAARGWRMGA